MDLNTKDAIKNTKDGAKTNIIDGGILGALSKGKEGARAKKFRPLGNLRDGITAAAVGAGTLAGGREGAQSDALDRDVRQAMGLKEKGWLGRNKGAIIGSAASLAGGLAGRAIAKKAGLSLAGLGTLAGIGAGSKLAGTLANRYVADQNRKERDREILAAKNKEQSNFTKNMYQTRQFNKLTDFVSKHKNELIGGATVAASGVAAGYLMDKKAKRQGNWLKRNAGAVLGGLTGAGAGVAIGKYGPAQFKKSAAVVRQESDYLDNLASKYYSGTSTMNIPASETKGGLLKTVGRFGKDNWKGAAIGAVGLGAAGAGIGRGKNKKKAMAVGAGVGSVLGGLAGAGIQQLTRRQSAIPAAAMIAAPIALGAGGAYIGAQRSKKHAKEAGLNRQETNQLMWRGGLKGAGIGALSPVALVASRFVGNKAKRKWENFKDQEDTKSQANFSELSPLAKGALIAAPLAIGATGAYIGAQRSKNHAKEAGLSRQETKQLMLRGGLKGAGVAALSPAALIASRFVGNTAKRKYENYLDENYPNK